MLTHEEEEEKGKTGQKQVVLHHSQKILKKENELFEKKLNTGFGFFLVASVSRIIEREKKKEKGRRRESTKKLSTSKLEEREGIEDR